MPPADRLDVFLGDIGAPSTGDVDEAWDRAAQIEQREQLPCRFALLLGCPREHRQRQVYERAVERMRVDLIRVEHDHHFVIRHDS